MRCPSCSFGAGAIAPIHDVGSFGSLLRLLLRKPRIAGYIVLCPSCGTRYTVDTTGRPLAMKPATVPQAPAGAGEFERVRRKRAEERQVAEEREKLKHDEDLRFGGRP